MSLRLYLEALLSAEQTYQAMIASAGSDEYGPATEAVYDAEQTLREREALVRQDTAQLGRLLRLCDAVARRKALLAAVRDLQASGAEGPALADAYRQHAAAVNAVRAAFHAWIEGE